MASAKETLEKELKERLEKTSREAVAKVMADTLASVKFIVMNEPLSDRIVLQMAFLEGDK